MMLIRVGGGKKGICEYLLTGRKSGRSNTRKELDKRIVLHGDLEAVKQIIDSMDAKGEKYLHITLSFKEDVIDENILKDISDEFRRFTFSAYQSDEYCFYSEAHLPKIKAVLNQKTGDFNSRKPHIHCVIPKINLLSWQGLNPFGIVRRNTQFIDSFQEYINSKYELQSPKDNRRTNLFDRSDMNSRYRGDIFKGVSREYKLELLDAIIRKDIRTSEAFCSYLNALGQVRVRNKGKENEYFNVKLYGAKRGINLKEYVFQSKFLDLPLNRKKQMLISDKAEMKENPTDINRILNSKSRLVKWRKRVSKEVKYLNSGNRRQWKEYQKSDEKRKAEILHNLEKVFYEKHRYDTQQYQVQYEFEESQLIHTTKNENQSLGDIDNVLKQDIFQLYESKRNNQVNERLQFYSKSKEFQTLFFNQLCHLFGLNNSTIPSIENDKLQYLKIDFLTRYMNFESKDIEDLIIRASNNEKECIDQRTRISVTPQVNLWHEFVHDRNDYFEWRKKTRLILHEKRKNLLDSNRKQYKQSKQEIYQSIENKIQRKSQLSILKMGYAQKQKKAFESTKINIDNNEHLSKINYGEWLKQRASSGDLNSISELRRIHPFRIDFRKNNACYAGRNKQANNHEKLLPLKYTINLYGDVTYYKNETKILCDKGKIVEFLDLSNESIEKGLQLSMMKYGSSIKITGTMEFQEKVALIMRQRRMPINFAEQYLNEFENWDRGVSR